MGDWKLKINDEERIQYEKPNISVEIFKKFNGWVFAVAHLDELVYREYDLEEKEARKKLNNYIQDY